MRDIDHVAAGTTHADRLRAEGTRLRGERQRLTDEAGRIAGRSVTDIEMGRRRISLQIQAVVATWRDALRDLDSQECDLFRVRAHAKLNYLDVAVAPYPDLQAALAAARSELTSGGDAKGGV